MGSLFLKQIGQGIQHVASRVENLPNLIQRVNDFRKMTGAGFTFLQLPRTYYGYLTAERLAKGAAIELPLAKSYVVKLNEAGIVDAKDIVDLDITRERVAAALPAGVPAGVIDTVLLARYNNLYAMLGDILSEEEYLKVVRNNILVDIQGEDLLLQIFTSKVVQRAGNEESCFLEFIQRVCSECVDPATGKPRRIKPGCGGFGIRNFLTLFLSIEVTKAKQEKDAAEREGNELGAEKAGKMVDAFTAQLDESNPVLTSISDAMTAEGAALEKGDHEGAKRWAAEKAKGNEELQRISSKYNGIMRAIRELK